MCWEVYIYKRISTGRIGRRRMRKTNASLSPFYGLQIVRKRKKNENHTENCLPSSISTPHSLVLVYLVPFVLSSRTTWQHRMVVPIEPLHTSSVEMVVGVGIGKRRVRNTQENRLSRARSMWLNTGDATECDRPNCYYRTMTIEMR